MKNRASNSKSRDPALSSAQNNTGTGTRPKLPIEFDELLAIAIFDSVFGNQTPEIQKS